MWRLRRVKYLFHSHSSLSQLTSVNLNRIAFDTHSSISHENAFQLLGTDPHVSRVHANAVFNKRCQNRFVYRWLVKNNKCNIIDTTITDKSIKRTRNTCYIREYFSKFIVVHVNARFPFLCFKLWFHHWSFNMIYDVISIYKVYSDGLLRLSVIDHTNNITVTFAKFEYVHIKLNGN